MTQIIPLIIFLISLLLIGLILVSMVVCCVLSLLPVVFGIIKKKYGWGIGGFLLCHGAAFSVSFCPGIIGIIVAALLSMITHIPALILLLALLLFEVVVSVVSVILCGLICGGSMVLIFRRSKKAVEAAQ